MPQTQRMYRYLPQINEAFIRKHPYFLIFETSLPDSQNFSSYIFVNPVTVIQADHRRDVEPAFAAIERCSKKYYLAGYFSYELGYCLQGLQYTGCAHPLIRLAVFDKPIIFDHRSGKFNRHVAGLCSRGRSAQGFSVEDLRLGFSQREYSKEIKRIRGFIRRGQTYQVNFTTKYRFSFSGSPFALYQDLKAKQPVAYSAFCKFGSEYVISLSPELFFRREGARIYSRPMKGTIQRGRSSREDIRMADALATSAKDRAENLMIVDMVRNDLGRVSQTGSVKVSRLFTIEQYPTLFQMTSTVQGALRNSATYRDIFAAMFPGGSVTGAPKIRTMQIIKSLEKGPRNIYCGALGVISPGRRAVFNLPIRTISIRGRRGEMGVGSGVTFSSSAAAEYHECVLKARFLTERHEPFSLLETMLWDGRFVFLKEHMQRLAESARYFDFPLDVSALLRRLKQYAARFKKGKQYRLRLLLCKDGGTTFEHQPLLSQKQKIERIAISDKKVNPDDVYLYHKTTRRQRYDSEYARCHDRGFFDVIFLNTRGEVTEGAISNIIIQKGGRWYTPPVSSGLLPGVFRASLLRKGRVKEKIIMLDELYKADKIFMCNSLRGITEVILKKRKDGKVR